jgi:hypothetical protein
MMTRSAREAQAAEALLPQGAPGLIRLGLAPAPVLEFVRAGATLLKNGLGRLRMPRPLTLLSLTHPKEIGRRYYSDCS